MKTITGKEPSYTIAFRLRESEYSLVRQLAERQGVKMAQLLRSLVRQALAMEGTNDES